MVISKYRPFPRNIDSLVITAKNNFLGKNPRNIYGLGITAKNNFLDKNQFFQGDLKIS